MEQEIINQNRIIGHKVASYRPYFTGRNGSFMPSSETKSAMSFWFVKTEKPVADCADTSHASAAVSPSPILPDTDAHAVIRASLLADAFGAYKYDTNKAKGKAEFVDSLRNGGRSAIYQDKTSKDSTSLKCKVYISSKVRFG